MKRCICAVAFPAPSTDLQHKVKYAPWCQSLDRDGWSHCAWELTSDEASKVHNEKESWELQNASGLHFYHPALWSVIWQQPAGSLQRDSCTVQLLWSVCGYMVLYRKWMDDSCNNNMKTRLVMLSDSTVNCSFVFNPQRNSGVDLLLRLLTVKQIGVFEHFLYNY